MSIASEIEKLSDNLADSYDACEEKDATIPNNENFDNLPSTILSIPQDFYATVNVYSEVGSTITYLSHTYTQTGSYVSVPVKKSGTATFTASLDGHSRSGNVTIYYANTYSLNLPLKSYIEVTSVAGSEITIGTETKTITDTSVTFTVWTTGTYTITAVYQGITKTDSVTVYSLGQTYQKNIVYGQNIIVYAQNGTDVILQNGIKKTITDDSVSFFVSGTGSYKLLCIYNGQAKELTATILVSGQDIEIEAWFVPSDYQEIEYVIMPLGAYIETDIKPTNNTEIKLVAKMNDDNSQVGCVRWSGGPQYDTCGFYPRTGITYIFYGRYQDGKLINFTGDVVNTTDVFTYKLGKTTASVFNNSTQTMAASGTISKSTFTSSLNFYIGCFWNINTIVTPDGSKYIYSARFIQSDVTSAVYVPCYRKSDNVIGMYDVINGVFKINTGSDTFGKGSNVTTYFLPSTYQLLDYISSSSDKSQYLDFGSTATDTTGSFIKVYDKETDTKNCVYIGARATENGRHYIGGYISGNQDYGYYGFNTVNNLSTSEYGQQINFTRTLRTASLNLYNKRKECYDDKEAFTINQTLVQTTPNVYAFCANDTGSATNNAWSRLYYALLTSGTTLSKAFIPCYRISDKVLGMYDIVNNEFKTNQGSGSFSSYGFLPPEYQRVEYIEGTGTQYIKTDIVLQKGLNMYLKFNYPRASDWIFASAGTNWKTFFLQRNRIVLGNSGYNYCDLNPIYPNATDIECIFELGDTVTVTGSRSGSFTPQYFTDTENTIMLFGRTGTISSMKLYAFNTSGIETHNFVPCYRILDNKPGLYDTEEGVFLTNGGSGEFNVGQDVN